MIFSLLVLGSNPGSQNIKQHLFRQSKLGKSILDLDITSYESRGAGNAAQLVDRFLAHREPWFSFSTAYTGHAGAHLPCQHLGSGDGEKIESFS